MLLDVAKSMDLLKKAGVKIARYEVAGSLDGVLKACEKIGYPVVLKVVSTKISHKTDVGGVVVGLKSEDEVKLHVKRLLKLGKVMVQEMVDGIELIIGAKNDPVFGTVVMFGLGGIFVELFKDVSFRVAPIDENEAMEMMQETKGYKLLTGFRGKKGNIKAVAKIISKVSQFVYKNKIEELDINPLIAREADAVAVDGRVVK